MNICFEGKKALVTGAGKGIGKAIAIRLAECGAEVLAVSRTQSDLDELAAISSKIRTLCLDIGNWENTKAAIQTVGPIDLLVNNAAVAWMKEFGSITEEEIDSMYNINVKAVINITQFVAQGMKERGQGGSIVNISSINSFRGVPNCGVYGSTKGALDQLTRSMAAEYGPHNIRVNSINPTAIRTNMSEKTFKENPDIQEPFRQRTPLRRLGEVDDIAYPTLFFLSDYASLISGVILPVDGGVSAVF